MGKTRANREGKPHSAVHPGVYRQAEKYFVRTAAKAKLPFCSNRKKNEYKGMVEKLLAPVL